MYHLFENNGSHYIYLPDYKQLFNLDEPSYLSLKDDGESLKSNQILHEIKMSVNEVDSLEIMPTGMKRYGLFLCIANICNAMCKYCFAGQGDYGKESGLMDFSTSKKAIDSFLNTVPNDCQANIIFFGGEPTLAFDCLRKSCEYVKTTYPERNYKFHIVTNATLLDESMIDYLSDNNFSVGVSIDGGESIQNNQRPLRNGKNSFIEATKNLDYLFKKVKYVHARGTYSDFNESLVSAYMNLLDLGFDEVSIPPDILNSDQNKEFHKLIKQLDDFYDFSLKYAEDTKKFPFTVFVEQIRRIFIPKLKVDYTCGLGEQIFSVDIKGDIYPCHRFSSDSKYKLGNVFDTPILDGKFNYKSRKCTSCWNQYTCSHGCCYNDYFLNENINLKNEYWCRYSQKMTELSLMLISKLEPSLLSSFLI